MRIKSGISNVLTFLLVVLYLAGTSGLELVHSFVHDHHAETHSETQEKDPCHRLIYHHEVTQGCDHDSHLIVSEKCQMCDLAYHGDQHFLSDIDFSTPEFSRDHFGDYRQRLESYWAVISSSRAPPVLA